MELVKGKSALPMSPVQRFWSLLRKFKFELRQIYAYAIFIGIVNLTLPLGIQAIINFLQTGELTTTWIVLVCFVLIGIAITGTLQVLQLRVVENMQQELFARSAFEFTFRLPKISFLQLDKIHTPELVNRFFDTLTIQKGLPKILIDFSLAVFQIIFGLILLSIYSPYFIILGLALILILWLIFQITGPRGLSTSLEESKYKYQLVHWLEELARVNRSFKLSTPSKLHLHKSDAIVAGYLGSREGHFQVLMRQFRLFIGFKVFVAAGLLVLGGYLVLQERMNIGQFVAAEIIIILIINSVEKVLRIIDTIYDVLTALEKIGYVTDLRLDQDRGYAVIEGDQALSVTARNIQFGFPSDVNNIFEDLSFDIAKNDRVLLKGKSGSGKTLLLQILAGIYTVEQGQLLFDGISADLYQKDSLFQALGVGFPTNQIFEGSIRENITLGKDVPYIQIMEIAKKLNFWDYIIKQPNGIDSSLDSGGRRLPRSVIQKLLIARTVVNQPKLLLLEDPLQFIAEDEKKSIVDFLMAPEQNWTVVVVSDFSYWSEKCNKVINLDKLT